MQTVSANTCTCITLRLLLPPLLLPPSLQLDAVAWGRGEEPHGSTTLWASTGLQLNDNPGGHLCDNMGDRNYNAFF